jgi:hypothetical protein
MSPGVYKGLSFKEYQEIQAVNNSVLKQKTPLMMKMDLEKKTDALTFGGAFHTMLLEPELFDKRYTVFTGDRRTKAGKEEYAEVEKKGLEIISQEDMDALSAMKSVFKFDHLIEGDKEVSLIWEDPKTGILCKCRTDVLNETIGFITDLKSTRWTADLCSFKIEVKKYQYHQQGAFYCEGVEQCLGFRPTFYFVPVEKSLPYDCAAYILTDELLAEGYELWRSSLDLYAECQKTGIWPGHSSEIQMIGVE